VTSASSPLPLLYRDPWLVAINKPAGLLVHRSPIDRHETRFALQLLRDQLGQRVFPLHRLDKPTSGVLLFALTPEVARLGGEAFYQQQVEKTYLALVRGYGPQEQLIDHPLREEDLPPGAQESPAQEAQTRVRCLARVELPVAVDKYPQSRYSLMECHPLTGRRHQIRRHLKHISHPIIGDAKHGKGAHNRYFQQAYGAGRLLLAATRIQLSHPVHGEPLCIDAPLDEVFSRLIRQFGWTQAVPHSWLYTEEK
jgi:tRNA pseudouridine65 synthase